MIHNVLPVLGDQLNDYLKSEYGLSEDRVIISSLIDYKGNPVLGTENKITVFLLNIEEEKSLRNGHFQSNPGMNPPISINLYVMFAATFSGENYAESLKFISSVISFFQGKTIFDKQNSPLLSDNIDRLSAELVNMDLNQLNNLWGSLGARYVPSLIYKFRILTYNSYMVKEDVPDLLGRRGKVNINGILDTALDILGDRIQEKP